jgi:threonine/homoserine/homoserine lactone efflux protein
MTAVTVAKGYGDRNAGAWIAVGHAVIEFPLILAIYFGLARFIDSPGTIKVIYAVGGAMLLYLGVRMFHSVAESPTQLGGLPGNSLVAGILITGTNSAFYIWWATVGVALVVGVSRFGLMGLALFTMVHWLCDLGWCEVLSYGTFKSRTWWTPRVQRIVFRVCALILAGFGAWFLASALV